MKKEISFMPVSIFILIFIFTPFAARAAFTVRVSQNDVQVEGGCSSVDITITLEKKENPGKVVYSGGVPCQNGKFLFSDDLLKWNMDDGRYSIMVNGQKSGKTVERKEEAIAVQDEPAEDLTASVLSSQTVDTTVAETVVDNSAVETKATESAPEETASDPETKFLNALVLFQQSTLDMRTWLAETSYPFIIKKGLNSTLDGIDIVSGKITDLLWATSNTEKIDVKTENNTVSSESFSFDNSKTAGQ